MLVQDYSKYNSGTLNVRDLTINIYVVSTFRSSDQNLHSLSNKESQSFSGGLPDDVFTGPPNLHAAHPRQHLPEVL